jgi:nucleotide-binding universal stress UspA family protein
MLLPSPPRTIFTTGSPEDVARTILAAVEDEWRSMTADKIPVDVVAAHGYASAVFGELSAASSLVVLQHRDLSRASRITSGSTVASVATHARCPVVSVPATAGDRPEHAVVTVGLHEDGGPVDVLEAAFAQAELRDASVRLVHALRLAPAWDDVVLADDRWKDEVRRAVTEAASKLTASYPDVAVDVQVRHDWPTDVLAELSRDSALMVLGRHGRRGPIPARLGALTRSAVAHAECPVMIVPIS